MTFVKGQSGNPRGRVVGSNCLVSKELVKIAVADGGKGARELAQKLWSMAKAGDTQAQKLVLDRLEGRVSTAEELAKRAGATEATMAPEQRRKKLLDLLRLPENREIAAEAVQPASDSVQ